MRLNRRVDDRVFWRGQPEFPQPPPERPRRWVVLAITVALGSLGLTLAAFLG